MGALRIDVDHDASGGKENGSSGPGSGKDFSPPLLGGAAAASDGQYSARGSRRR